MWYNARARDSDQWDFERRFFQKPSGDGSGTSLGPLVRV
jgi:hypothetical protein